MYRSRKAGSPHLKHLSSCPEGQASALGQQEGVAAANIELLLAPSVGDDEDGAVCGKIPGMLQGIGARLQHSSAVLTLNH